MTGRCADVAAPPVAVSDDPPQADSTRDAAARTVTAMAVSAVRDLNMRAPYPK
jgi:hypothetical protein